MKSKSIEYFEWQDIREAICIEMDINKKYFRDYHKLIGGEYKDLWHEWMEYFDDDISNGSIKRLDLDILESLESKTEWVKEDGKEWLKPFVEAVYKVWKKYEIKYVRYYW